MFDLWGAQAPKPQDTRSAPLGFSFTRPPNVFLELEEIIGGLNDLLPAMSTVSHARFAASPLPAPQAVLRAYKENRLPSIARVSRSKYHGTSGLASLVSVGLSGAESWSKRTVSKLGLMSWRIACKAVGAGRPLIVP